MPTAPEIADRAAVALRDGACQQWAMRSPAAGVLLTNIARAVRHDARLRELITAQEGPNRDPKGPRGREVRDMRLAHALKLASMLDALDKIVAPYRPKARA